MGYYKKVIPSFFDDNGEDSVYYYNSYRYPSLIAFKDNGKIRLIHRHMQHGCELTRAKAYRYWEKYFPDKPCYALPLDLQIALDYPPVAYGYYIDKHGEKIGYEG